METRLGIKVKLAWGEEDPTFEGGSTHIAHAELTNPTAKEWTYTLDLYLDVLKVASSAGTIAIPAGGTVVVDFPVTMPLTEGTWHVYFDVYVGAELLVHYEALPHATQDVTVVISPDIVIGPITWE
ncbi:unnamed protein product [marine sediment metagenome]|uniref:Uncharacterized protein n=1 Tax=marine sediment metagenome TaxID=412755 RepID=X1ID75_9ZZZZ